MTARLLFAFLMLGCAAEAQTVVANALTGTGYIDLQLDPNAPHPQITSAGTRFMWGSSYLYVGNVQPYQDLLTRVSLLGQAGEQGIAIFGNAGEVGVAIGRETVASDMGIAIGWSARALGRAAIAINPATEAGASAVASSELSIAIGFDSDALAPYSTAIGLGARTTGDWAAAYGPYAQAAGDKSFAVGFGSITAADESMASGHYVSTSAIGAVALGRYNVGSERKDGTAADPAVVDPSDPILTLGNGTGTSNRSNAITVYRDGTVRLTKAAGGISMGQFN